MAATRLKMNWLKKYSRYLDQYYFAHDHILLI